MEKDIQFRNELMLRYPRLYKKQIWPEFSEGWFDLVDKLSAEIYQKYEEWGNISDLPYVAQMKEKFGGLRFYLESDTFFMDYPEKYEELDKIIAKYEKISQTTCEECGSSGTLGRRGRGYWLQTLCVPCNEKKMAKEEEHFANDVLDSSKN
jgi:hypothetical protein